MPLNPTIILGGNSSQNVSRIEAGLQRGVTNAQNSRRLDQSDRSLDQADRRLDQNQQQLDGATAADQRKAKLQALVQQDVATLTEDPYNAAARNRLRTVAPAIFDSLDKETRQQVNERNASNIAALSQLGTIGDQLTPEQIQMGQQIYQQKVQSGEIDPRETSFEDLANPQTLRAMAAQAAFVGAGNKLLDEATRQAIQAGFVPGTREFTEAVTPRRGALVEINNGGEPGPGNEKLQEGLAKPLVDATERGFSAGATLATLSRAEQLLDRGVSTGALAPMRLVANRMAQALGTSLQDLGLDIEDDSGMAEALQAMSTQLALQYTDQTSGAISNFEMQLFLDAVPGLSRTEGGNRFIISMMKKVATREQDVGRRIANLTAQNKSTSDIYRDLSTFGSENQLFTDDELERFAKVQKVTGGAPQRFEMSETTTQQEIDQLPTGTRVFQGGELIGIAP